MTLIETRNDVLLLVGREDFSPPRSFGGAARRGHARLRRLRGRRGPGHRRAHPGRRVRPAGLGEFVIEAEGLLSLRDVWNKEYDAAGVTPGLTRVTVHGDDDTAPTRVALVFAPAD